MILLYKRYKLCHAVFMEASKVKDIKEKEIGDTMKEPKFSRLKEDIKAKIVHSEWKAGDKIPSENMFAAQYHISRQTVRKAIGELTEEGYLYAEHGRGTFVSERTIHTRTSKNIAVVTTYLSDYIFPRLIQGIEQVLTANGYSIMLKTTRNSRAAEARCMEELLSKDIDGLIIEPSKTQISCRHTSLYDQMDEYGIPYVFIQGYFEQMKKKPYVLMDDMKGGYLITKYLIELGHKNIHGIFKADDVQGQARHKGYVRALQEAGMLYDPDSVTWFYTEDREVKPRETISGAIQAETPMDAVVCYNDQVAVEVIRTLREFGKKVPRDVSVTGFDNSLLAKNNHIPITTISHPQDKLGSMAAELLLRLIRGEELTEQELHIRVEPEIVVRDSTWKR